MAELNEFQRKAVTAGDGPVLVLAGAGSGKTTVIVERLVWLIEERGVDPRHLLALTFTNRAANEMKNRVMKRLGLDRLASWVGTFHSFGLFVLRREMERLGRSNTFTIFDEKDQETLVKRLLRDLPGAEGLTPRKAMSWISRLKQDIAEPDPKVLAVIPNGKVLGRLWTDYHDALRNASAVDFDDLLVLLYHVLERFPEAREKYQRRFKYVLVDEYQDTNRAQYLIAKHLTAASRNLFVVGDEDQSIYSWRGAHIGNILKFEKEFPGAATIRLEENYRSTAPILDAANAVVAHNEQRLGKTLWTSRHGGDPVRFYLAPDAEDEARWVAEEIARGDVPRREVAILYRTSAQSRRIEEALRAKGIPHVVVGGVRFYSRKEVKDLLCYLRLITNPTDDESLRRIINVPTRGIGATTMAQFEEYATRRRIPLFDVLREVEHDQTLSARARTSAAEFVHLIDDLSLEARKGRLQDLVESLIDKTRYREYIEHTDEKDMRDRMEIVDEFRASCAEFDAAQAGSVTDYLQNLSLASGIDEWKSNEDSVTLMTCHSAKGLEFDSVFLVGLEEGLLPHGSALVSESEMEEERRLCYVAMTRARRRLALTAAQSRMLMGETDRRDVSRFVREIPKDKLNWVRGAAQAEVRVKGAQRPAPVPGAAGKLKMGMCVRHAKFGKGLVLYTQGAGDAERARIRFETGKVGTFLVKATPLEIVE